MNRNEALAVTIQELLGGEPQKEVARRAGIPESVFSLYKRGRRYPKDDNKERLAEGLGVTLDQFNEYEWENLRRKQDGNASSENVDSQLSEMLRAVDGVHDAELRKILCDLSTVACDPSAKTHQFKAVTRRLVSHFTTRSEN